MIAACILAPGTAQGQVLVLSEPLSFWGGFDPKTGCIIDVHHPQHGASLAGHIVLIAATRGSGTAPGALAEAIRRGTAPAAIIMIEPDVNIAIGATVAEALYGRSCPIVAVSAKDFAKIARARSIGIGKDGAIAARR